MFSVQGTLLPKDCDRSDCEAEADEVAVGIANDEVGSAPRLFREGLCELDPAVAQLEEQGFTPSTTMLALSTCSLSRTEGSNGDAWTCLSFRPTPSRAIRP